MSLMYVAEQAKEVSSAKFREILSRLSDISFDINKKEKGTKH